MAEPVWALTDKDRRRLQRIVLRDDHGGQVMTVLAPVSGTLNHLR